MAFGNELYSVLSAITGQNYLLLTELPDKLEIQGINYELYFSDSYTGQLYTLVFNEDNPYVVPLQYAFEHLLQQGYNSFLLTTGCTTVSVYTVTNCLFKVFDSHARDSCGMVDPTGTCVLLELDSIINLIEYFKTLHSTNMFLS